MGNTYREAVLAELSSRRWKNSADIQEVGGADGLRRLRELRAEGYEFKSRPSATGPGKFDYRLTGRP